MVYAYTPDYYSSFHDTITSLCKSILPFNLRSRRTLPDQKLAKRQSDNLKWQQESFHRILQLIELHKEDMVPESDVLAFRTHLLDTLIASPPDQEPAGMIRDRLLFLQELLYAKCISAGEYHASKRPLLQRLAVLGVELDCRDVIIGDPATTGSEEEEWSVIELRDKEPAVVVEEPKLRTPLKAYIKNAASWRVKGKKDSSNPVKEPLTSLDLNAKDQSSSKNSILMPESSLLGSVKSEKGKRKTFRALFHKEQRDENKDPLIAEAEEKMSKYAKKQWSLKWKRSGCEDECTTPYLPPGERSDDPSSIHCTLVASPIGEGPDTKKIKKKIHSDGAPSDFFVDKVLGDNIKRELSRIQSELSSKNANLSFTDEQIEAISTRLPVDKSDLKNFFPKTWCDRYGEIVLDVVRKEFKDHVGEMETLRNAARDKHGATEKWVAFEDNDENFHPNIFSEALLVKEQHRSSNRYFNNPFYDNRNPFCSPSCNL